MIMTEEINGLVKEIYPELVKIRRKIHQYPEIAFNEKKTAQLVFDYLSGMGIEAKAGVAKTGVKGLIGGNGKDRTVALRADMDALPVAEENECEYKSTISGMMHACGHDVHVTCLLGAAHILQRLKDKLNGNVTLIFQPAEEGVGGALPMINEGVLDNPRVNACAALHVWPDVPAGQVGIHYGTILSSRDSFKIIVRGKGGHGAMPHLAIDPITTGAQIVCALQTLVRRKIDALNPLIVSICSFQAGNADNIIPDTAILEGTVRTVDSETKEKIPAIMKEIITGIASSSGAECELIFDEGFPATVNDDKVTDIMADSAMKTVGKDNVIKSSRTIMVSEDFSYFAQMVPCTYIRLGCGNSGKGLAYPLHSPKFNVDEECIKTGAAVLAQFAVDYLQRSDV